MFTSTERNKTRNRLIKAARIDRRITGGATTGSASVGKEDEWSDIDLAFGVRSGVKVEAVLKDFTALMYKTYSAIHHLDVPSGTWIYRVFFLNNTLQVDLAFAPEKDFGAKGPTFKLLFGKAEYQPLVGYPEPESMIGHAWLYALHARSCIARGKVWQAEYMISQMRERTLALACLRHNLPIPHGRGMDALPKRVTKPMQDAIVTALNKRELKRAFSAATAALIAEIEHVDKELADRLSPALNALASSRH